MILAPPFVAEPHLLPGKSTVLLTPRVINVHTMVWDMLSCQDYFAQPGNPYSHFGTGWDGDSWVARQWQDLTYRAASDLNGNPFCVSIENADRGFGFPAWSGSDVPRLHPEQAEVLAQLIAWLCVRFAIPPYEVPNSLPGVVGPGKHRDGIDPWRVIGGVLYSNSYGKVCPGDRRIAQFHDEVMPRVRQIIAGTSNLDSTGGDDGMAMTTRADGRIDVCIIGTTGKVYHYYAPNLAALPSATPEDLGGGAKAVSCGWTGDVFVLVIHGLDDRLWTKQFVPGSGWSEWYRSPVEGELIPNPYVPYVPPPPPPDPAPGAIIAPASADRETVRANAAGLGATDLFLDVMLDELWGAATAAGVDAAGMVAQSLKETGFGTYAGAVREWFHNPAGIKVRHVEEVRRLIADVSAEDWDALTVAERDALVSPDHPLVHQQFPSWRVGAAAHAQRLLDYCLADAADYSWACGLVVDPRHGLGSRGITYWEELGGRWAPSPTYGEEVADLMRRLTEPL